MEGGHTALVFRMQIPRPCPEKAEVAFLGLGLGRVHLTNTPKCQSLKSAEIAKLPLNKYWLYEGRNIMERFAGNEDLG